jgi:hypothetical protein
MSQPTFRKQKGPVITLDEIEAQLQKITTTPFAPPKVEDGWFSVLQAAKAWDITECNARLRLRRLLKAGTVEQYPGKVLQGAKYYRLHGGEGMG